MNDAAAVNSICILRLSALGDATHVLPLIRTLQKNLPDCRITWILGKGEAKLMDFVTKSPKVKMDDGSEEEHKAVNSKDMAQVKNMVQWILAQ